MKRHFLDLGDGKIIPKKKIVLILNAETASMRQATRDFIRRRSQSGDEVLPKKDLCQVNSIVLTNAYGKDSIYSSSRSSYYLSK